MPSLNFAAVKRREDINEISLIFDRQFITSSGNDLNGEWFVALAAKRPPKFSRTALAHYNEVIDGNVPNTHAVIKVWHATSRQVDHVACHLSFPAFVGVQKKEVI